MHCYNKSVKQKVVENVCMTTRLKDATFHQSRASVKLHDQIQQVLSAELPLIPLVITDPSI